MPHRLHNGTTSETSRSRAPTTGAAAATAEPPQIELSTAINVANTGSSPSRLPNHEIPKSPTTTTDTLSTKIASPASHTSSKSSRTPNKTIPTRSKARDAQLVALRHASGTRHTLRKPNPKSNASASAPTCRATGKPPNNKAAPASSATHASGHQATRKQRHSAPMPKAYQPPPPP